MSLWDDYKDDYDPFDQDEYDGDDGPSREIKVCNRCGERNLVWTEVRAGVFRLYDPQLGRLHTCPPALDFK